jgi:hypothetical protein
VVASAAKGCPFYLARTFDSTARQWHDLFMPNPLTHPAHGDIAASIAADMRKAEAHAIELGFMRRRADGRAELTEAGEDRLFGYIAKEETRH